MKQSESIKKNLRLRLLPERLCYQDYYLRRMNTKLEISFNVFANDSALKNLTSEELNSLLNSLDILQRVDTNKEYQKAVYQIKYNNSDRIVLITGIKRQFVDSYVDGFKSSGSWSNNIVRSITQNEFWISIEFNSVQYALSFKKIIRSQKREADQRLHLDYKIPKKRVRIIIQNEDLFTILIDAMCQIENRSFIEYFGRQNPQGIIYSTIPIKGYNDANFNNEEQIQDTFSQEKSKTSQAVDSRNLKDCIQTQDQGIQSQKIQENQKQLEKDLQNLKIEKNIQINSNKISTVSEKNIIQLSKISKNVQNQGSDEKGVISQVSQIQQNNKIKESTVNMEFEKKLSIQNENNINQSQNKNRIYNYTMMKKLYHQRNKIDKNGEAITRYLVSKIPQYLIKQDQRQISRKFFYDGIWKQSKFGRKNLRKSNLQ